MRKVFSLSRYLIWVAVISLLFATLAVFIFGLIATVSIVLETFRQGHFDAEGARLLSVELIEMIDLFLLGTILFITAAGLQELFVDPGLKELLPAWMSVESLDELKFNLLAVIVVMLAVLFLGVASSYEPTEGASLLTYGVGVAAVILASGITVFLFAQVHHGMEASAGEEVSHSAPHEGSDAGAAAEQLLE